MKVDVAARPFLADLEFVAPPIGPSVEEAADVEAARKPRVSPAERYKGRRGYNEQFLGFACHCRPPWDVLRETSFPSKVPLTTV